MVFHKDLFLIHFSSLSSMRSFYFLEDLDIVSYADGTTIYAVEEKKQSVIDALEKLSLLLFKWFNDKFIKANIKKVFLL